MYAKPSRSQILNLKYSLTCATKGTQSISSYLKHIKQPAIALNSTGVTITSDDVIIYVLNGLSLNTKVFLILFGLEIPHFALMNFMKSCATMSNNFNEIPILLLFH